MPPHHIPETLCLHEEEPDAGRDTQFDVFLCYRGRGADQSVAERLRDKLQNMGLKVFFEAVASPRPKNDQIADAMCNSAIILLLVSRDTFEGIGSLETGSERNWLIEMLWQYEMALELFCMEQRKHALFPLLVGNKTQNERGRSVFKDVDEYEDRASLWRLDELPQDVEVKSIVKTALHGLKSRVDVAISLDDKMLPKVEETPSIIRGRTVQQTIRAMSSMNVFKPLKLPGGDENHSLDSVCRELKDLAESRRAERKSEVAFAHEGQNNRGDGKRALEEDSEAGPAVKTSKDSHAVADLAMPWRLTGQRKPRKVMVSTSSWM